MLMRTTVTQTTRFQLTARVSTPTKQPHNRLVHYVEVCNLWEVTSARLFSASSLLSVLSSRVWEKCPSSPHIYNTSEYQSAVHEYEHVNLLFKLKQSLSVCLSVWREGRRPSRRSESKQRHTADMTVSTGSHNTNWLSCVSCPPVWSTLKTCRTSWDICWSDRAAGGLAAPPSRPTLTFVRFKVGPHFCFITHCWPVQWGLSSFHDVLLCACVEELL